MEETWRREVLCLRTTAPSARRTSSPQHLSRMEASGRAPDSAIRQQANGSDALLADGARLLSCCELARAPTRGDTSRLSGPAGLGPDGPDLRHHERRRAALRLAPGKLGRSVADLPIQAEDAHPICDLLQGHRESISTPPPAPRVAVRPEREGMLPPRANSLLGAEGDGRLPQLPQGRCSTAGLAVRSSRGAAPPQHPLRHTEALCRSASRWPASRWPCRPPRLAGPILWRSASNFHPGGAAAHPVRPPAVAAQPAPDFQLEGVAALPRERLLNGPPQAPDGEQLARGTHPADDAQPGTVPEPQRGPKPSPSPP